MPNRILREGIITSERVNTLSPGAEILYRRLMSVVDDYGRIEAHPQIVLARCYPLQLDKVSAQDVGMWLAECAQEIGGETGSHPTQPLITIYSVKGKKYLQINDFGQRERTPKCPGPQDADIVRALSPHDVGGMHALARASNPPTTTHTNTAAGKNGSGSDFVLHDWYERQYARHPIKRDKILGEQIVSEHLRLGKLNPVECERVHIAWCESEDWRWKNGAKVKQTFAQWIFDESYRYMPNGHAKPEAGPETAAQVLEREARQSEADDAARALHRSKTAPKENPA